MGLDLSELTSGLPALPVMSMVFMCLAALVCAAIPIVLLFVFKKKGADVLPFFIGCAVFVLFALTIEGAINFAVSRSALWEKIYGNVWIYAAFGGLMAGVFEETGRFIAFKTVLKKRSGNDMNALMYGAGHGGIEAVMTVSLTYLVYILLIPFFTSEAFSGLLPAEASEQLAPVIAELIAAPAPTFLVSILERCIAITAHIAFSVIVWFGAKKKGGFLLYTLAILLHALLDFAAVVSIGYFGLPLLAVEGVMALAALLSVVIAVIVWKKNRETAQPETVEK